MKFTLDRKIQLAFISCTAILLVIAIISFQNSEKFITASRWVAHTHEVLYELEQIQVQAIEAETGARGFIISGNEDYLEPYNTAQLAINDHIAKIKQLTEDNPAQERNASQLETLTWAHLAKLEGFIELRRIDAEKSKALFLTGESRRILNKIRNSIKELKAIEESLLADRERTRNEDAQNFSILFVALLIVIGVVLIAVYGMIMVNLRALRRAENAVSIKNWSLTGTSELIKEMQGNKHVAELCPIIIRHVATYLKAELGVIYIADEKNTGLKPMASYAGKPVDTKPRVIQFGEGLIGQAAAEKRIIALHDVDPLLYQMHTTFGYIKPKSVLAVPCVFEGEVLGALELGTTKAFSEQHFEYLQIVADSVAIGIASSQAREEIKNLLEETQQQAQELETQQFELKQSNEALVMKSDLLEKSEVELKTQQEELQQTNVILEEKATLLEEQKEKLQAAKSDIEKKAQEIEVTSKYKSEFLANMSHELRTPLNSVLILAQILSENKNKRLGEKEIEYAKTIFNSGNDLLNLINEILDLSKIEAGKMQLDIEKISIESILQNMRSLFSEMAINKGIDFVIEGDMNELPAEIITDKQRVEQILRNLLSNAFKFTSNGGRITLYLSKTLRSGKSLPHREDAIYFSVNDTGIGIPKDKLDIIFEAFQQADGSTKRQYGGTGLGLSISRELSHVLGGEIMLESKEGVGSTFTLLLPINFTSTSLMHTDKKIEIKEKEVPAEPQKVPEIVPIPEPLDFESSINDDRHNILEGDRLILIIEDDENFANILLNVVRERKYKGIIALQGITGISYARHYKPDAIFLDMKMPVMDGMEVLTRLKNDPELRHIPVQIVSAFDKKKEMLELGAFNYIQKPVTSSDLQKAFEKIESFKSKKLKRLLIIEDNEQQNKAIRELIGNGDVKSFSAYSGMEAQKMLSEESFDCIIVDLGLPDMTGFELLEKIKANDKLNKIPVIVYTGRDLGKEETTRLNKLADTVVLKTANSHERLLDETILFLHRVESRLPKDKQTLIRKLHHTDEVLKDKKILLVDDDVRNVYSLTNALEEEGLECVVAENGKMALELLKQNKDINLVLMDIMMPVMDGYEATVEIRKVDDLKKLPIIALTAKAMKGDKEKCLAVGMSDYISKPVNIPQLLSLMRVWLYQ